MDSFDFSAIDSHAKIEIPLAADIFRVSPEYWSETSSTFIEKWPGELVELSVDSVGLRLSEEEMRVMGGQIIELGEGFDTDGLDTLGLRTEMVNRLQAIISDRFPGGAFVRLGSRSPKDRLYISENGLSRDGRVVSGEQAFLTLTACSERIYEDLQTALAMGYQSFVWLREWLDLEPWQEFRCFVQNRELVGISQYDYQLGMLPKIANNQADIEAAIRDFMPSVINACHLDDVVMDVFLTEESEGLKARLLEINPFGITTDPGLFDWNNLDEFDGRFKYCTGVKPDHLCRGMDLFDEDEDEF